MAAIGFVVVWSAILCSLVPIADPNDMVAVALARLSPLLGYWWPTIKLIIASILLIGSGAVIYFLGKASKEENRS